MTVAVHVLLMSAHGQPLHVDSKHGEKCDTVGLKRIRIVIMMNLKLLNPFKLLRITLEIKQPTSNVFSTDKISCMIKSEDHD